METIPTTGKKHSRKRSLPQTDIDLGAVATQVVSAWANNDWLKVKWISQFEFQAAVNHYNTELSERLQTGATRPAVSAAIKQLETELDQGVRFVKTYLYDKYGTAAKDHYHAFGYIKVGKSSLILPRDQNQKAEALVITLQAITSEGFDDKQYGKNYWIEKTNAYNALLLQAKNIDSSIASKVGNKNEYRNTVIRGLNSIIWGLKSNFPDTYAAEIRSWGFQKEKY